ncbi:malectin domain-containing carbohydrate-binding protein [Pontiella agarivorans]|uniref:Malectin domain-containing carbohydrate-binding protein n=1 Tax=Pontiella agarivorans TaxID=3038953 RepID=A0ABU5MTA9_9BACT|nr:malectin domain-containing carbohydrate-binding protein [Pontiella agarivorans]MDZ8117432.1 malectin domain-containing carbohydrate-binding protein [Pontiella agarivorans]
MRYRKRLLLFVFAAARVWGTSVLEIGFSDSEGFFDGTSVNTIQGMSAQLGWIAEDTAGIGYMVCTSSYNRAQNYAGYTLEKGESVIIETTLRLQGDRSAFSAKDLFRIGFAEKAQHSGADTPSIGAELSARADGGYSVGRDAAVVVIPPSASNDWIKISQVITRSTLSNTFTGIVHAYNVSRDTDLGTTASAWTQSTDDGSWGGTMRPGFRAWNLSFPVELQVDHWKVYTQAAAEPPLETEPVHLLIDPEVSVAIGGHLELDRRKFINLSDAGRKFETRTNNDAQETYYIEELGMNFGRELGGAYGTTGWSSAVREDSENPGQVDIAYLTNNLRADNGGSSAWMMDSFNPNLDVATHDRYGSVPDFMDAWYAEGDSANHLHAVNINAYAEYVAAVLEYGYTDWTRPKTYEIVNEPNWRVWRDQRFADLHTAVKNHVQSNGLDVAVGGPCMSVGYFYKNNYQNFGLDTFMANTGCDLDFYSFHIYDYMSFDTNKNDFVGRVSTGLPIEGVLDMVENYALNTHGKTVDMVLSEHGGYISTDQEGALDLIADTYFPSNSFAGTVFEWEMKRRSVSEHLAVSSAIANTLAFMNNPHVVRKAVPFILLESAGWNPRYYSTLLVKENFDKNSEVWHESTYVNFFKFFRNVEGRRVRVMLEDPDIQTQAYVSGTKLFILMNNLADRADALALNLPTTGIETITLRRFGRNTDFTPFFTETQVQTLEGLQIGAREALAIEINYSTGFAEKMRLNEVPYYGDLVRQEFAGSRTFNVAVPEYAQARSAMLRISVGRDSGLDNDLDVVFNGTPLDVPLEDCADRLDNGSEYGSLKLIPLPANLLQAENTIQVSFPGSGIGGIGSVVIRAALEEPDVQQVYAVNCAGPEYIASDGTVYRADAYYSGGSVGMDSTSDFSGTEEDTLYVHERYGEDFSYAVPVPDGDYTVTLHMAENWFDVTNGRIFSVDLEGENVISNLDLVAEAGRAVAYDQPFNTTVNDGSLDIDFYAAVNHAKINAIKAVRAVASGPVYSDWVLQQGLSLSNAVKSVDDDGDGFDTYAEFIADTDPLDSLSRFRIDEAGAEDSGFGISFPSSSNRTYTVRVAGELSGEWQILTNGVSGTGNMLDIIDPALSSNRFYRIDVEIE